MLPNRAASLHRLLASLGVLAAISAAACSGGAAGSANPASPGASLPAAGSSGTGGGTPGGATSQAGTGSLAVRLTDTPFSDAKAVLVTFSDVSVHRTGGGWETLHFEGSGSLTCDLKQLENLSQDLLAAAETLEPGKYTQIRLVVDHASIHFDNAAASGPCAPAIDEPAGLRGTVTVPSGEVRLNQTFTIDAGQVTTILLDFDGDASIRQTAKGTSGDAGNGGGNGNGNGGNGCNGNGKKPGCESGNGGGEDGDPEAEEDLDAGTFLMHPVLRVVSIG